MGKTGEDSPRSEKTPRSSFRARLAIALGALILAGAGAAAGALWWEDRNFHAPGPGGGAGPTVILVESGSGLPAIAAGLERAGVVHDAFLFRAGVVLRGQAGALKAGEYAIPPGTSMAGILGILAEGRSIVHRITVAEGLTSEAVAALVNADPVLAGDPVPVPAEGTLLPETYFFHRGMTRAEMMARMARAQQELLDRLWPARAPDLPIATAEEAVILASIVEKETSIAAERPRIAAVFVNRLRRGMRLQSDPTIIYGITGGKPLGRGIRQSEIARPTPYNTYQIDGLPPTPIANPGRDSIAAVLDPLATDDLFFVADGTGGHVFAATPAEHARNVARWRRIERERGANGR